ncbi:unnamed protein product [Alopecurus aequalis]
MKSFLAHLARWAPPGGEHDEQGEPGHPPRQRWVRGYLWWATWFFHKLVAQHRAAEQLRLLKERARDVGERRLRYGVEVPEKSGNRQMASSSRAAAAGGYAAGDDEEEDDDDKLLRATQGAFTELQTLDDYVRAKLRQWQAGVEGNAGITLSMVVVAPDTYEDVLALVQELWLFGASPEITGGYHRIIVVDVPVVHPDLAPLRPKEVLFSIFCESSSMQNPNLSWSKAHKKAISLLQIEENIQEMKIYEKLDKIKSDIQGRLEKGDGLPKSNKLQGDFDRLDLDVQLQLLLQEASQQDQKGKNKDMHRLPAWDDKNVIVKKLKEHMEAVEKELKEHMEATKHTEVQEFVTKHMEEEAGEVTCKHMEEGGGEVSIHKEEEEGCGGKGEETSQHMEKGVREVAIRREEDMENGEGEVTVQEEVGEERDEEKRMRKKKKKMMMMMMMMMKSSNNKTLQAEERSSDRQATKNTTSPLGEDEIKKMINDAKEDILRELHQGKYDKSEGTGEPSGLDQNPETISEKIGQMMDKMKYEFKEQLKIKGLVDRIKYNLNNECPLIILKVDELMDVSAWEDTRNALSLLNCSADLMIVTATKDIQLAKEYCYPRREPIDYSLAGLYHDTVLELTGQVKNGDNCNSQIFHDILDECEPHELCMKMFTHALYANPKRSDEDLFKLHSTLQGLPTTSFNSIAKVMFKFSYNDLPKEYKSCLLYLAIFHPGKKVRRSTLIARWVAEGLTSKEYWPSSVRQANRCFDELVGRCFVYPADVGATGFVKSCIIGDPIHGFITTIARKQHIVETRLSHHLARHFSIFNDLQLRSSDRIDKFFEGLSKSSQVSLLKVLDLEGCRCFIGKNQQRYLRDIYNKMLLLKYLSLRKTDITQLPGEINNLRELEDVELNNSFCGSLLSSFEDAPQIAKMTLRDTLLEKDALQLLTKKRNIRSLVLLDKSFDGTQNEITLEKDDFLWLNLLEVHCSSISKISFTRGSAPRLEKIVWSSSTSLSDIDKLPRLKELEFTGDRVPDEVTKAIGEHENEPSLKLNVPETED